MPRTPIYPPKVEAAVKAFHQGRTLRDELARQPATLSARAVAQELEADWWRAIMNADEVDDTAAVIA